MTIKKLLITLNELTNNSFQNQISQQHNHLKSTLRQLRMKSKELEKEIQLEMRKDNQKILQEKYRIITQQRRKGLCMLKDLRKVI